ncbi:MAG: hypothetical protein ABIP39_06655 [Polyangiaceae bacterium]
MNLLRRALGFLVATALVGLGCSSSAAHAGGATCSVDSDCNSGSCLELGVFDGDGGSCRNAGKACSKACSIDGDCASLGANFKCFEGCGAAKSCGQTL